MSLSIYVHSSKPFDIVGTVWFEVSTFLFIVAFLSVFFLSFFVLFFVFSLVAFLFLLILFLFWFLFLFVFVFSRVAVVALAPVLNYICSVCASS